MIITSTIQKVISNDSHTISIKLTLISILICTYDRKQYIGRAVKSLLGQDIDKQKFEIVVVKGFTDETIDEFLDANNVKTLYLNEKSLGKKIAQGVMECRGDFICFLDDDDEFEPNKIRKLYDIIDANPDADFIHNSILKISEDGTVIDSNTSEAPHRDFSFYPNSGDYSTLSKILRYRGDWYLSAMCIRKSVIELVVNELQETNQSLDKFIFFAVLNHGKKMMMIGDKLTSYRMHQSTTTYGGSESNFIAKREIFFQNTVHVFDNIALLSRNFPGNEVAKCLLIQHRINLFFISQENGAKVSIGQFIEYLRCLKIIRSRYQLIWISAFLIRKISIRLSRYIYYIFFKMSFGKVVTS